MLQSFNKFKISRTLIESQLNLLKISNLGYVLGILAPLIWRRRLKYFEFDVLTTHKVNELEDMSGNVNICQVTAEVKQALKEFRFRKTQDTAALVLKVDREKQEIIIDEKLEDITIEELQEGLQSHQPRYIILSYRQVHKDGRVSYPLCFIYFTPRDSHAELQMMYAGSKMALQREAELTRGFEIRELEDLTEDWLLEKLGN